MLHIWFACFRIAKNISVQAHASLLHIAQHLHSNASQLSNLAESPPFNAERRQSNVLIDFVSLFHQPFYE